MTSSEITQLNDLPAGEGVVGILVLVFVVLIALDLLGTTDIIPAIKRFDKPLLPRVTNDNIDNRA